MDMRPTRFDPITPFEAQRPNNPPQALCFDPCGRTDSTNEKNRNAMNVVLKESIAENADKNSASLVRPYQTHFDNILDPWSALSLKFCASLPVKPERFECCVAPQHEEVGGLGSHAVPAHGLLDQITLPCHLLEESSAPSYAVKVPLNFSFHRDRPARKGRAKTEGDGSFDAQKGSSSINLAGKPGLATSLYLLLLPDRIAGWIEAIRMWLSGPNKQYRHELDLRELKHLRFKYGEKAGAELRRRVKDRKLSTRDRKHWKRLLAKI